MVRGSSTSAAAVAVATEVAAKPQQSCKPAQRAIRFYKQRTHDWQRLRLSQRLADRIPWPTCHMARRAANEWHARAEAARDSYERWHAYHYDWAAWMPHDWQRRSRCELGYDLQPRSWTSNVTNHVGRFHGFVNFYYPSSWDSYKVRADPRSEAWRAEDAINATPRQQYEVALVIWREVGPSAWGGCG